MTRLALTLVVFLSTQLTVSGADWPQWLGPRRDGSTPEKVAPWTGEPAVVWRHALGEGYSAPVVAGGRVFVHARVPDLDEEEVRAFDAASGKPLWRRTYVRKAVDTDCGGYGPRATPAVFKDRLYTFGISGIVTCWNAADGEVVWRVDTHEEFHAPRLKFGVSSSPLVVGDVVIAQVGGKDASLVAFDLVTGRVRWKSGADGPGYSSPALVAADQTPHVVVLTPSTLLGVEAGYGKVLWEHPNPDLLRMPAVTPVAVGPMVFTSHALGGHALRLEQATGQWQAATAWKSGGLAGYTSTPVAVGVRLITVSNSSLLKKGVDLCCVELATGKEVWRKPALGKYHAGLVRTGDDKMLVLDETGVLALVDPMAADYRELARSKISGPSMSMPALTEGRLFVRDDVSLACIKLPTP